jgi:hypothetical protein
LDELALVCRTVTVRPGRHTRQRLRALSDRIPRVPSSDPYAIAMARLGIDGPSPAARALQDRLVRGGYRSRGLVADACLIALVETGVGVWACAADELRIEEGCVVGAGLRVPLFTAPPRVSGPRVTLYAVVVPGVAVGVVEEAVEIAADIVGGNEPRSSGELRYR